MKWYLTALFMLVCFGRALFSELLLSGEAGINLCAFPVFEYTVDRFDSPLNPGNCQDLHDITLDTDFIVKLAGEDEKADFNFWLAVKPYNLAQALFAAAPNYEEAALVESLTWLGPKINDIDVLRASIAWYIGDFLILRVGRQSMLTGYGYGWNPIDFTNPLKDPFDPDQELKGVDALTIRYYLGNIFTVKLAGIYRPALFESGVDYSDLQASLELTGSFPSIEAKLCGFYDYDESEGQDAYVPGLGAGLKIDLAGAGVYGESALLWGSRSNFPDSQTAYSRKANLLFSGILGLEYTFESELSVTLEYFYNGEGYDLDDRRLYRDSLELVGLPTTDYLLMYRSGYFAKHYLLLNIFLPLYSINTDINLSCLYSPDSWAFNIVPRITFNVSGSLSVDLGYIGLFSLEDGQFNEAWFSPVKHVLQLEARYSF